MPGCCCLARPETLSGGECHRGDCQHRSTRACLKAKPENCSNFWGRSAWVLLPYAAMLALLADAGANMATAAQPVSDQNIPQIVVTAHRTSPASFETGNKNKRSPNHFRRTVQRRSPKAGTAATLRMSIAATQRPTLLAAVSQWREPWWYQYNPPPEEHPRPPLRKEASVWDWIKALPDFLDITNRIMRVAEFVYAKVGWRAPTAGILLSGFFGRVLFRNRRKFKSRPGNPWVDPSDS